MLCRKQLVPALRGDLLLLLPAAALSAALSAQSKTRTAPRADTLPDERAPPPRAARTLPELRGTAMPPKFPQAETLRKLRAGESEESVRQGLKDRECPASRIAQLIKGARQAMRADCDAVYIQADNMAPAARKRPASAVPMPAARRRLRGNQTSRCAERVPGRLGETLANFECHVDSPRRRVAATPRVPRG